MCPTGKREHKSQLEARRQILQMWKKRKTGRMERREYLCKKCGCWHLTSQ